jgi:hypothetical protein
MRAVSTAACTICVVFFSKPLVIFRMIIAISAAKVHAYDKQSFYGWFGEVSHIYYEIK